MTCKDRDIIIQTEDIKDKPDEYSRMYYYKRCTMPENTDFSNIKCRIENNQLFVEAPVNPALTSTTRQIPIEFKKSG